MKNDVCVRHLALKTVGFLIFWPLLVAAVLACSSQSKAQDKDTQPESAKAAPKISTAKVSPTILDQTLEKYSRAKSVQMDVKKELKLALLDRTESSEGKATMMGKEKIRLEYTTPVKSIAVVNGQKGWVIEYPPADIQDVVRVLRFSWSKKDKKKFLLASLLNSGTLNESFKLSKKTDLNGVLVFDFLPKKKDEEVKRLKISVKDNIISELEYLDPLNNKTKFNFSNVEFDKKIETSAFDLKIPKGAEVTDL